MNSKLKKITVALGRHGKTHKQAPGQTDKDRVTTVEGDDDSMKVGTMLRRKFDLVLASPAQRCVRTAALMADIPESEVVVVPELYPEPDRLPKFNVAFEKHLGYTAYPNYLVFPDVRAEVEVYGAEGLRAIRNAIIAKFGKDPENEELNILAVAHAVCLNAVAVEVGHTTKADPKHVYKAAQTVMDPSGVLMISVDVAEQGRETLIDIEYITPVEPKPA